MATTNNNCIELVTALGLQASPEGLFVGRVVGFPIGMTIIDPTGNTVLLFQVRHWLMEEVIKAKSLIYDATVSRLLENKAVDIEFEDRFAWLTINDLQKCLDVTPVSQIIESILGTFRNAGLIGDEDLCHYCQKEKVQSPRVVGGKVVQICPDCLDQRLNKRSRAVTTGEAVPIFLMTPFAALIGAILWAGFWTGYTLFFERLGADRIWLPGGILVVVFVGLIVGGPVGWIIKQNRRRGRSVSVAAALIFASLAVILGEVLYLTWLIYHKVKVISFPAAFKVMPNYYLQNDPMFIFFKIINAMAALATAEIIAKPKEASLDL